MPRRILLAACLVAALAPAAKAQTYKVDPVHSTLLYRVKHMDVSYHYGRFDDIAGTITMDADPAKTKIEFTVKVASVNTGNKARDGHLTSADFFNAAQYPRIKFVSTKVAKDGDAYDVTGNLTMHNVTKPIRFKLEATGTGKNPQNGKTIVGFESKFPVKRSEFGIGGTIPPAIIGDDVTVIVGLECGQQ
ncbi:MAG TPA: YceI family protein [Isosphaeraceae bacterium]|jgi:polyisoprenoid-binding protein YceI|nr:YceI family protein [Isosphaeraceae bacterium]